MTDLFAAYSMGTKSTLDKKVDLLDKIIRIEDENIERYKARKIPFTVYAERDKMISSLKKEFYSL